jgi:localization factor PodJL
MRHVPWHVKGVRPEAREVARDAARRSGLSVGEWLNSIIIDADANADAEAEPVAAAAPSRRETRGDVQSIGGADVRFAAIGRQIDKMKRRIDDLLRAGNGRTAAPLPSDSSPAHLADAIMRIDRELQGLRRNGGHALADGVDEAFAEISARQQALDAEYAEPHAAGTSIAGPPAVDLGVIELQLRDITERINGLQGSCRADGIAAALARSAEDTAPRQAIEGMEKELRRLASRLDAAEPPPQLDRIVDSMRHDLADISRRIDTLPQRGAAPIEDRIRALSDQVAKLAVPPRAEDIASALRSDFADIRAALRHASAQPNGAAIEEQVRALAQDVAKLHPPLRAADVADAVRRDLADVSAALHNAMPTSALAALEQEVRSLNARIEANRMSQPDSPALADLERADLERALADISERLGAMTPAEDLATLNETIKELSRKADAIASDHAAPDLLRQLEQAIAALHGLASQVASQDAVAALSRDIQGLAERIDRGSRQEPDIMSALERRLAEMTDVLGRTHAPSGPVIPADFDTVIKRLADRLEAIQIPTVDPATLKNLEQRVAGLADKLDASQDRLGRIDLVERGMGEVAEQLKELRAQNEKKLQDIQHQLVTTTAEAISAPAEAIRRDVATLKEIHSSADRRTQDTFEAVYSTIEQVADRLAAIEQNFGERKSASAPAPAGPEPVGLSPVTIADAPAIVPSAAPIPDRAAAAVTQFPPAIQLRPSKPAPDPASKSPAPAPTAPIAPIAPAAGGRVMSDLPPDAPLEPGSGARRVRMVANAIDRIAASEAANAAAAGAKPPEPASPARANFVAAARRAAQAVASEHADAATVRGERAAPTPTGKSRATLAQRMGSRVKSVFLFISVILIVLGALRLALDLFHEPEGPASDPPAPADAVPPTSPQQQLPADAPRPGKGAGLTAPMPITRNATGFAGTTTLGQGPASGVLRDFAFPVTAPRSVLAGPLGPASTPAAAPAPVTAPVEPAALATTGSVPAPASSPQVPQGHDTAMSAEPQPTAPREPPRDLTTDALPATIGSKALIAAATAGEPGASYEIASRYAEGRNVPQDLALAAAWFERATRSGMAPAQFRLGSMYEKGLGLKRDLQEARRLYLAAADRGNAKAMHNLAVLYAEGIDGKPDYPAAAQWFRKAAGYGVVDSQYNLAILYARGVGIGQSLAESYKWFALAAKGGDKDASKKRDDIASRLEPRQLEAAKQAVEAFVAEHQPEEANATKAPPGGWDQVVAAAPTKPKAGR